MATKAKKEKKKKERVPCPISREQFKANAKPVAVIINGTTLAAKVKEEFSTGSFGFFLSDKVTMEIDGVAVRFQCSMNLTAVNSGPPKKDEEDAAE